MPGRRNISSRMRGAGPCGFQATSSGVDPADSFDDAAGEDEKIRGGQLSEASGPTGGDGADLCFPCIPARELRDGRNLRSAGGRMPL